MRRSSWTRLVTSCADLALGRHASSQCATSGRGQGLFGPGLLMERGLSMQPVVSLQATAMQMP
eukprot:2705246-Pyramimonas_sp.AAC.1